MERSCVSGRARVCIVTPGQIGSNPRVVKEAQALQEAGYNVTVIATRLLDRVEPRDRSLLEVVRWDIARIDLRAPWSWRLRRGVQVAFRAGYAATGWAPLADRGFSAITGAIRKVALRTPADLYIAHYPAALPAVAAAADKYGTRIAYDAEDFHLGDWPDVPEYEPDRSLVRAIEGRYLPRCAYVSAASDGIADAYAASYDVAQPTVILNVFPRAQAPAMVPTSAGSTTPGPSLYWFSQTIGPDRGLECVARALGSAQTRPHLYLRGTPVPGYVAQLERLAVAGGATGRIHILEPAPPAEMERLAAAFDVGLCTDTCVSRSRAVALTNKLFTYLLAGVPPIISATPAHIGFAAEAGLMDSVFPPDDPDALAATIDRVLASDGRLQAARSKAWQLACERYNWDLEAPKFLAKVHASLSSCRLSQRSTPASWNASRGPA